MHTARSIGSSPLARGLPTRTPRPLEPRRIIPARAGFTDTTQLAQLAQSGSSPLARGLRRLDAAGADDRRIIPARAGFTGSRPSADRTSGDHPRSRGVYRVPVGDAQRPPRIIPARAGFTCAPPMCRLAPADHPRSRGVYRTAAAHPVVQPGSSPLARGLRAGPGRRVLRVRIIPARAGFTHWVRAQVVDTPDHPRSRGVYVVWSDVGRPRPGSSPLARGLRAALRAELVVRRIIPARAGFTRTRSPAGTWSWDHPRSRGVYRRDRRGAQTGPGSSPLARGLRSASGLHIVQDRIIPARAGFTAGRRSRSAASADHPRSRGVYHGPTPGWR